MGSMLVRVLGFPATLIHGDPLVLDRWLWLKKRLPSPTNGENLIDVGCGTGAFTIGAALRGYKSLGLSWDDRNQSVARERALICKAPSAKFEVFDVRKLDQRKDLFSKFDIALSFENIEHILDDRKLMQDIAKCLKPGGRLLLTTPNDKYRPISAHDAGPFSPIEDGRHVRKGYNEERLIELCNDAGLDFQSCSFCSGFLSQKLAYLLRLVASIHPLFAWAVILPFRILPPIFDPLISKLNLWPQYSICLEANKPSPANNDALARTGVPDLDD
jgi:2-polyprenyl-3-methyl-5-hydroxy-6-metoxy-1,4-benzoquinol methylase